jgi:hypothetical protein
MITLLYHIIAILVYKQKVPGAIFAHNDIKSEVKHMKIIEAVVRTFKNVNKLSIVFIYIGLEFTVGLLVVSLIITLLEGHFGDYISMLGSAQGASNAALSCGALSLVAAFLCDAAAKDREKQN